MDGADRAGSFVVIGTAAATGPVHVVGMTEAEAVPDFVHQDRRQYCSSVPTRSSL